MASAGDVVGGGSGALSGRGGGDLVAVELEDG
jgi:hypothetical protein